MAEMTAEEAVKLLKDRTPAWLGPAMFYISERESQQIAALIQQQAATIEAQGKTINLACNRLAKYRKCPPEMCDLPYHPGDKECTKHWGKWLEQQVKEGQG